MKEKLSDDTEKMRIRPSSGFSSSRGDMFGAFRIGALRIISSGHCQEGDETGGWEHVSASCNSRCPSWEEMHFVKKLFWDDSETVIQFHPKQSEYINDNEFVLHLWKQAGVDHELPPRECV